MRIFSNHRLSSCLFILLTAALYSCKPDEPVAITKKQTATFIHISHTRTNDDNRISKRALHKDYEKYDLVLLGGDMTWSSSSSDTVMEHIDSVFDIRANTTLWALGNHDDVGQISRIKAFTNRDPFYAYYHKGITFLVLHTQANFSKIEGEQLQLFNQVLDTLNQSSHLIILHHKLIWMAEHPVLDALIPDVSNGRKGDCYYCINENNFYTDLYPGIINTQQKGIQVICLGGDIGKKTNAFEYRTEEGIYFLASGINDDDQDHQALLFTHCEENRTLDWDFHLLEELP